MHRLLSTLLALASLSTAHAQTATVVASDASKRPGVIAPCNANATCLVALGAIGTSRSAQVSRDAGLTWTDVPAPPGFLDLEYYANATWTLMTRDFGTGQHQTHLLRFDPATNNWTQVGTVPTDQAANGLDVAFDQLLVSTEGGLFATRDGRTFERRPTTFAYDASGTQVFFPPASVQQAGDRLYASSNMREMMLSLDRGQTWTQLDFGRYAYRFVVVPVADGDLIVGATDSPGQGSYGGGTFVRLVQPGPNPTTRNLGSLTAPGGVVRITGRIARRPTLSGIHFAFGGSVNNQPRFGLFTINPRAAGAAPTVQIVEPPQCVQNVTQAGTAEWVGVCASAPGFVRVSPAPSIGRTPLRRF